MKRCHRLAHSITEPYQEFSFEKSLRKYEKTPSKRVKMDHFHSHRNALQPIYHSQGIEHQHFAEKEAEVVFVERQESKEENRIENFNDEAIHHALIEGKEEK